MLIKQMVPIIEKICARERCPFSVLGSINGSGRVTLKDPLAKPGTVGEFPKDLDLEKVLDGVPKKYDLKATPSVNRWRSRIRRTFSSRVEITVCVF